MSFARGDFAAMNNDLCVIVGVEGDPNIPEEHLAAWFGSCDKNGIPEVWTIPAAYFVPIEKPPVILH